MSGTYHSFSPCSEEVEALAQRCHMRLYRTSVKEDINICNVFQHLAENYVNQVKSAATMMSQLPLQMRLVTRCMSCYEACMYIRWCLK